MVATSKAIQFAVDLGWTKADAKRADSSTGINLKLVKEGDKLPLAMALADFAGEVLFERQRLQAAQKSQVTRKKNEIKTIKLDYAKKIEQFHEDRNAERSVLVSLLGRMYAIGHRFGLEDPWVETLLEQYKEYNQETEVQQAS